MPRFCVVSLNCYNLFAPGAAASRGPRTSQALTAKITMLAATLKEAAQAASGQSLPDIICLCEVGEEAVGRQLAEAIAVDFYQLLWSTTPNRTQTGLMICYNPNVVLHTAVVDDRATRGISERCKWFAAQFLLRQGTRARFWLVLNHWKSQRGGETQSEPARSNSAREIGEFFLNTARSYSEAMLLIGDFNCEPGAVTFKKPNNTLRVVRERALVLRDKNRLAYLYNPMWRLHGEADAYETTRHTRYKPPRPPGTYCPVGESVGWLTLDQLMVSKRLLTGGSVRFLEASLRVVKAHKQCSDHCALAAVFDYD